MIITTVIVKFSDGHMKKYHKGCAGVTTATIAIKAMKRKIKQHNLVNHLRVLGVIWSAEARPWREDYEFETRKDSKMETKFKYH